MLLPALEPEPLRPWAGVQGWLGYRRGGWEQLNVCAGTTAVTPLLSLYHLSFSFCRNLTRNITLPGTVSWAGISAAMSHTRRSTSSIFTWVKLQSSSSSQARWPRGRCQWRRQQWQAGGVAGTVLHWGQHQEVLSNGCATAWTVYSISCVCRSKQKPNFFLFSCLGKKAALCLFFFKTLKVFFFLVVLH